MARFVFRAGHYPGRVAGPLLLVMLVACGGPESKPPASQVTAAPARPDRSDEDHYGWVVLESGASIFAELADTPARQQRGFMYREVSGDDAMLFLFPFETYHSIWMKNCLSPLDVIWIDRNGQVLHVEENLPPCPEEGECPGYGPMQVSLYVLELAAGEARRRGISPGSTLQVVLQKTD